MPLFFFADNKCNYKRHLQSTQPAKMRFTNFFPIFQSRGSRGAFQLKPSLLFREDSAKQKTFKEQNKSFIVQEQDFNSKTSLLNANIIRMLKTKTSHLKTKTSLLKSRQVLYIKTKTRLLKSKPTSLIAKRRLQREMIKTAREGFHRPTQQDIKLLKSKQVF